MAGHSKWAQIKRQKEKGDAAKSAAFGKLARRITIEAKKAGGNTSAAGLRAAIEKARQMNMPKENIERATAKGASAEAGSLESVVYETYGPGGAAIVIEALTDNKNRTSAEIKHLLFEQGLALAAPGSALWAFEKTAESYTPKNLLPLSEEDDAKLMALMEKIDAHDDVEEIYTNAE